MSRPPPSKPTVTGPGHDVANLYRRFGATVLRRCQRFLPEAEAEEAMHEVFVKLLENPEAFRGESSPATWLYRVTTRLCIDRLRVKNGRSALVAKHLHLLTPQCDPGEVGEARRFLDQLWRDLDDELAMVGVLYYIDGLTTAEIGRTMGVSDRTIANRLTTLTARARKAAG